MDTNTDDFISEPSYDKPGRKKTFKIVDGKQLYRILPPCFEAAKEQLWSVYEAVHWGTQTSRGVRPFRCICRKRNKMVVQPCPKCDQIALKLELKEKLEAENVAKKIVGKAAEKILAPVQEWLDMNNLDKKHWVNAINEAGEIGRLGLGQKFKEQLDARNKEILDKSKGTINPVGRNGVWYEFERTGNYKSGNLGFVVAVATEEDDSGNMKRKLHTLTPDLIERMKKEAWDLKNMYPTLNEEQIQRLVDNAGDPTVADEVFGGGEVADAPATKVRAKSEPVDATASLLASNENEEMLKDYEASKSKSTKEQFGGEE